MRSPASGANRRSRAARPGGRTRFAAALIGAALAAHAAGCSGWTMAFGGDTSLDLRSSVTPGELSPKFIASVFVSSDSNTADIYLSDLPLEAIAAPDTEPLDNVSGVIVHAHYFVTPQAGRTPIDFNASNASIRVFVLAPAPAGSDETPALGVYGGGGFLLPGDAPEGESPDGTDFSARVKRATVRLTAASPGFADRLAIATLGGHVRATRDPAAARAIAANLIAMVEERAAAPAEPAPAAAQPN